MTNRESPSTHGLPWLAVALAFALFAPIAGTVSATPGPAFHLGSDGQWAYGGNRSISINGTGTAHNLTYSVTAWFGFHVLLTQTTLANGTIELEAQRTMGASFLANYCVPDCTQPVATASISYHALEVLTGFTNLTSNATVLVNGTAVRALGLLDSETTLRASVSENDSVAILGDTSARGGVLNLSLGVSGQVGLSFQPALGLVPISPSPGTSWSSTSGFSAAGSWALQFLAHHVAANGTTANRQGNSSGIVDRYGNVSLRGADLGSITLANGNRSDELAVAIVGPFHLREGFLLLPLSADLFGATRTPGAPEQNGTVGVALSAVDFLPSAPGHLGVLASSASFAAGASNPVPVGPLGRIVPSASPAAGPVVVQAQPESISAASQGSSCIVGGSCSVHPSGPAASSPSSSLRPLAILVIVAVGLVAVIGAAVAMSRRPKVPPRINVELYPPAPGGPPAPASGTRSPPPRPPGAPEESDPLGHLL